MNNYQFLLELKKSFLQYLCCGARSDKKLIGLHGAISDDLYTRLDDDKYMVYSLGFGDGKERRIVGRYLDKKVDITIAEDGIPVAGIAVKYVMSNYKQNTNNYFENMFGETANIRANNIPYFQIFVIPDKVPYFKEGGTIGKWETINEYNLKKYIKLSNDDTDTFFHTPNKTLLFIVHIEEKYSGEEIVDRESYINHYMGGVWDMKIAPIDLDFGKAIIFNDYDKFMQKVVYTIKSL